MPRTKQPKKEGTSGNKAVDPSTLPTPALDNDQLRLSYRIARGEQGVLTFEPYKSLLLPYWRFRTVPIAEQSSQQLWTAFTSYVKREDFVGADMARKFIQMGMTRAKRYANHKGGKKYDRSARQIEEEGGTRVELPKSAGHEGMDEKLRASEVFKAVWMRALVDEGYVRLREEFLREQKAWDKGHGKVEKDRFTGQVKKKVKSEVKAEDLDG